MSVWEFAAAVDGWARANGAETKKTGEGMSEQRMRDLGIL